MDALTKVVIPQVDADNIEYFELKLEIEYTDPKEAGRIYGQLLDLERRSEEFYSVFGTEFEINSCNDLGDYVDIPESYSVRVSLSALPLRKVERILQILLEDDSTESNLSMEEIRRFAGSL